LECDGFVPVNYAPITPGDTIEATGGKTKVTIKIFKVSTLYIYSHTKNHFHNVLLGGLPVLAWCSQIYITIDKFIKFFFSKINVIAF
jgi:hypothetical protein